MMNHVPAAFGALAVNHFGAPGRAWVAALPAILSRCVQRWQLVLSPPYPNLSHHFVIPAVRSAVEPVVLKIYGPVPAQEFTCETAALQLCAGQGMVRLLDVDAQDSAMLLERAEPGTPLRTLEDDEQAMRNAAAVMRRLWRPAPTAHSFPTIADWGQGLVRLRQRYNGGAGPFPAALLATAEALYAELLASAAAPVVLHGDLHQENILAAQRVPWLAIDPKGLVGEPAYEVGALLHNWLPDLLQQPDPGQVLARRVDILAAELGIDRNRIRGWGIYSAVLSAWWSVEDGGDLPQDVLTCGALLAKLPA